jgi:hypothetical protein
MDLLIYNIENWKALFFLNFNHWSRKKRRRIDHMSDMASENFPMRVDTSRMMYWGVWPRVYLYKSAHKTWIYVVGGLERCEWRKLKCLLAKNARNGGARGTRNVLICNNDISGIITGIFHACTMKGLKLKRAAGRAPSDTNTHVGCTA